MSKILLVLAAFMVLLALIYYSFPTNIRNSSGIRSLGQARLEMSFDEISSLYPGSPDYKMYEIRGPNNEPISVSFMPVQGSFMEKDAYGFLENKVVFIYKSELLSMQDFQNKLKEFERELGEPVLEPPPLLVSTGIFTSNSDVSEKGTSNASNSGSSNRQNTGADMTPAGQTIRQNAVFWEHEPSKTALIAGYDDGFAYFWLLKVDKYDEYFLTLESAMMETLENLWK